MAEKPSIYDASSTQEGAKGKPRREHPEIPEDSVDDEPKGTPSSERYHTEIATSKLKGR